MTVYSRSLLIADNVALADTFFTRFKGLMGKRYLGAGEGLLLKGCSSIHCFFMKMTIDAVYLSKDMTVLEIETLPPWHVGKHVKNASHVLELAFAPRWLSVGDVIKIEK